MSIDYEIFEGKSLSSLFKDIYENTTKKRRQIDELVSKINAFIQTLDDATDFVIMHVRAKDDTNIIDTIYDIYHKNVYHNESFEVQVAHYWFNADTGSQIHWESDGFNTNWNRVESA